MNLDHVTFVGPQFEEESELIAALPNNLIGILRQINGFILLEGALHVRGLCSAPAWHSLKAVLLGPAALHNLYPNLKPSDIPFAQDCLADQYLLRERSIHKLEAETGIVTPLRLSLPEFFQAIQTDPVEFLGMQPLLRYQRNNGSLKPGQVLQAYPPFCTKEAADGVSLKSVPAGEAIAFLADFSRQISSFGENESFHFKTAPQ